jgi:hypothetical protein
VYVQGNQKYKTENPTNFGKIYLRGDQEGLFKLVTLDRFLNRTTGVTSGCWWLVVVNAIPTGTFF